MRVLQLPGASLVATLGAVALLALVPISSSLADAVPPPPEDAAAQKGSLDPAFEARLKNLETELRCLVCQNQTLADSNAGLAEDLRREVRSLALAGKSDAAIKDYLHERYGNFIFYRPPVEPDTWLLWFGPFVLLLATVAWLVLRIRRTRDVPLPLPESERQRVDELLSKP